MNSKAKTLGLLALSAALLALPGTRGWAASHSDAPLIKQDPQANLTDVYAWPDSRASAVSALRGGTRPATAADGSNPAAGPTGVASAMTWWISR